MQINIPRYITEDNNISKKRLSWRLFSKHAFFNQQIQIMPPEGLNATNVSPLSPGGGYAPSVPSVNSLLTKPSLKDLNMRAKAGLYARDIQKEAHISFSLGMLNEEKKHYKDSIKHFKRFFFCARILDDSMGAGLALNRLGCS